MRKRWAERSKKSGPLDLTESPAESPLFAASEFDPDRLSMVSLVGASDDDQMSTGEKETDSLGLLGASAKAKSTKRPKIDLVDVASEASSGSAVAENVPKFDQRTFNHAKLKAADLTHFKFPWERGYLQKIFSSDDGPGVDTKIGIPNSSSFRLRMNVDVNMHVSTEVRETNMQSYGKCIYAGVVRTAADIGYQEERMRKRALAVNNWWKLLSANANASQLGKKVLDEAPTDELDAYGKELVDACFGVKSPNTLLKRYYSVNSFAVWCDSELNENWLPLNEKHVWLYVRHLKLSQASATKPASFLEALRFCWFVLGTDGGQEVLASFRVRGLSAQMFSQKKEWQPADTLTVDEVKRIHTFMDDEANHLTDRVLAGHLLHMLYVRARWSDLLSVKQAYIDSEGVYFELVTKEHKGAKGADAKAKLLPLVAPCMGVTGNWASKYLDLREKAGLTLPQDIAEPMLPAPSPGGEIGWSSRPMSSEEGSEFLRRVLGFEKRPERRISSHSLKSTSMSWTSKYGLNFESRALLARHVSAVSNPTAVYSRDLLSPVLRAFSEVVMKIGGQTFEPDKTRSGMLTPAGEQQAPSTPWMSSLFTNDGRDVRLDVEADPVTRQHDAVDALSTPWHSEQTAFAETAGFSEMEMESKHEAPGALFDLGTDPSEISDELSETSESECSTSSSSSDERRLVKSHPIFDGVPIEAGQHYVNNKSAVLHCVTSRGSFRCGRKVTSGYTIVQELNGIRCSRCYDV